MDYYSCFVGWEMETVLWTSDLFELAPDFFSCSLCPCNLSGAGQLEYYLPSPGHKDGRGPKPGQ